MTASLGDMADGGPNDTNRRDGRSRLPRAPKYQSGYSRFVLLMKLALPVIAAIVVVMVVIWPELRTKPDRFQIGVSDLKIDTAGGQRVVNARFTGVDSQNRPFSVTADSVVQPKGDAELVDLEGPKADITLSSGAWIAMTSPAGQYWRDREMLEMVGGVDLFHDEGYELHTEKARVDFKAGTATGETPVSGQGPFGTINSEGFRILESGAVVEFSGRARLVLFPEKKSRKRNP